ncbi:hypothetical protein M758_7G104700 [Ceratodon purpureus]|uniref:Uncharacterized protein n=1 Tax=Ceratodon purpureus TaxID=3225 RepID=A0A8T0H8I1_CERPU|nr:hypothetical protein KC19_7G111300 [Ceratodon purpureus]KAG0610966.1 hypothetical protein M758_7G104700 [Ceratodon purpureus]
MMDVLWSLIVSTSRLLLVMANRTPAPSLQEIGWKMTLSSDCLPSRHTSIQGEVT